LWTINTIVGDLDRKHNNDIPLACSTVNAVRLLLKQLRIWWWWNEYFVPLHTTIHSAEHASINHQMALCQYASHFSGLNYCSEMIRVKSGLQIKLNQIAVNLVTWRITNKTACRHSMQFLKRSNSAFFLG